MKSNIHPPYNSSITVTCACGSTFKTGSTINEIQTEICKVCHPFYTGKQKLIDTTGLVDKFNKRMATAQAIKAAATPKKARKPRTKA